MRCHRWNRNDVCEVCGVWRSGYSGGCTGCLSYYAWCHGPYLGDRSPPCDPTARLSDSVRWAETHHPLPRCMHGHAVRDGAGERLEPSCGCTSASPRP
jgi:hypothetical protein